MLLHMLPFLWQRALRCKMLSLWCSFLELCIWHFPYVFFDICANVFIFTTEDVSWKMASIQCSFLRIGSGPFLRLSFPLWNMLPSSWHTMGVGRPLSYPLLPESSVYSNFLEVQHTYWKTWCLHWWTCRFSTQTCFAELTDGTLSFFFTQPFWTAFLLMTDVSWEMLSV